MSKESQHLSDRELLIRIDERTAHLPKLVKQVDRHEKQFLVLFVVVGIYFWVKYPDIVEALARIAS